MPFFFFKTISNFRTEFQLEAVSVLQPNVAMHQVAQCISPKSTGNLPCNLNVSHCGDLLMICSSHLSAIRVRLISSYINTFKNLEFEITWSYWWDNISTETGSFNFNQIFFFNPSWTHQKTSTFSDNFRRYWKETLEGNE